ncbi:FUSC family protein [Acidiphilium sp. AL]|uniref:FUSC family protein n=1 Tax=Acidiphilium iwatense TaxID=768198 RepID=A0ABS9DR94_9PROT|nr:MULTISPECIES: FUSC family protein [Acidiphilium]MCF3945174.1 FUSC family protein [Acidiphilium iwatense]MCU4160153.1 FUSC family protein [Acidiphilium sp. AL]
MARAEATLAGIADRDRAGLPSIAGLTLNFRAISLLEGVRAAIAVAGTMAAGSLLGAPRLGIAALGALLACFADPGGPVRARLPPMLIFGVLGAICFSGFGLILARSPTFAILLAGATIFACSFARIYGQGGLQTGNLLAVATVLSLDTPVRAVSAALAPGVAFWAGAAGAALLTLALWRIRPFGPARAALADIAAALASLTRDLVDLAADGTARSGEDEFDLHARGHRRAVREAIERARAVTLATLRRRGAASARANAIALRLAIFDQLFGALIAIGEALAADPAPRRAVAPALRDLAALLDAVAPAIEADRSLDIDKLHASLASLREAAASLPAGIALHRLLDVVAERLAVVLNVSKAPGPQPLTDGTAPDWRETIFGPIRANLTWNSVPLRHAVRTALVSTPVLGFVFWLGDPFGHWLAITVIFVLQPHFAGTWVRAIERVAGTAAGGVIAALIGLVCHTRLELALAMIPLTMLAFAIRGVNYSAYIAILTPMIVLLIEQIAPGMNQWRIAASRVGFTLAGGLLAVAANLALWPSFESNRLASARDEAIAAHRAYLAASFAHLLDRAPLPDAARRQAGLASNNLEASISRALMEPHRTRDPLLRSALVADAALRRVAGRLAVLGFDRAPAAPEDRPLWQAWRDWLDAAFDPARGPASPAPAPVGGEVARESLTRLARQAELVAEALHREADHERE